MDTRNLLIFINIFIYYLRMYLFYVYIYTYILFIYSRIFEKLKYKNTMFPPSGCVIINQDLLLSLLKLLHKPEIFYSAPSMTVIHDSLITATSWITTEGTYLRLKARGTV